MPAVSVVRDSRPNVKKALEYIEFEPEECEVLVIKPHLCCSKQWYTGATTDPRILEQLFRLYEGLADEIYVVESDGYGESADEIARELGIIELCEHYGARWVNLSRDILIPVERDFLALENPFPTPRTVLKADLVINVPKMKTHSMLTVSLGLANMFRIVPRRKEVYYPKISEAICDVLMIRSPELTILDAGIAMEGNGPLKGTPRRMGLTLASRDPVAIDTIACRIMGINPIHVEHIVKAGYYGFGEYAEKRISVRGESIENVRTRFRVP